MCHEIKNSLYKTRNTSYLPAPCTIDDVNIEGIWSKTLNGKQFILHNSKHPIFGTFESLKQLSKSDDNHLFFDRMFKSCPNPFYHLIRQTVNYQHQNYILYYLIKKAQHTYRSLIVY